MSIDLQVVKVCIEDARTTHISSLNVSLLLHDMTALVAEVERLQEAGRHTAECLAAEEPWCHCGWDLAQQQLDRWVTVAGGLAATLRDMKLGMCHPSWQWLCAYDALVAEHQEAE